MITSVPQFIDVEDKVAGPLTWKQLGWMIGMGAVLFLLYNLVGRGAFFIAAIPVVIIFFGLAFYRPNGMSLARFVFYAVGFFFRPKVVVWERPTLKHPSVQTVQPKKTTVALPRKQVSLEDIQRAAQSVDKGFHGKE